VNRVALVLAGGAARGAYEVGVVQHIVEDVARELGRDVPLDILCGTSVGALNTCFLAAYADDPRGRGNRLADEWRRMRMSEVIHPDPRAVLDFVRSMVGRPLPFDSRDTRRGGILDPTGIERLVDRAIPFERIRENLAAERFHGLTVSTTHVGSGRTVVFVERGGGGVPHWGHDVTVNPRAAIIGREHALASAAIPFLFPAVRIDGEFYCDGGLRQNVPLSPARRLGATGLIVVSPRLIEAPNPAEVRRTEEAFPGPLFLLGKALNALLLDRVDNDIDRLERINGILDAGMRRYGPGFLRAINEEIGHTPGESSEIRTRPLRAVLIRASEDIGKLASAYVRSAAFSRRVSGVTGLIMRRIADAAQDADLLSYLLFDGEFADSLIALGRADARRRHAELCSFFEQMGRSTNPG
jgi:NTE family protein